MTSAFDDDFAGAGSANDTASVAETRSALLAGDATNPALKRLKNRLQQIPEPTSPTAYSRMHHRHNRD